MVSSIRTLTVLVIAIITTCVASSSLLDALARDVERVEAIRDIKNVQKQLSHLAQFGQWRAISQLFTANGTFIWGNNTVHGSSSIEQWFIADSGAMDGLQHGSLSTLVAETPVISLSVHGGTANGRWNGIWFQGDGNGGSRIQGGVYENEYAVTSEGWRISMLKYYAMYEGAYEEGWKNVDGTGIGLVPYHFTPESSGIPIPPADGGPSPYNGSAAQLEARIQRLNDEDEVRNLMHAHGFYVDRRMWTDVVDLHTENTTVEIINEGKYSGKSGVRTWIARMGPEGLTQGINNDHPLFDFIVDVDANGEEAVARGIEIGMLGDANSHAASWEFNVLRTRFVKEGSIWKITGIEITPLLVADYYKGWGEGGLKAPNAYLPPFLDIRRRLAGRPGSTKRTNTTIEDLQRRLRRSAAYDGAENQSHTYGYFADDVRPELGDLFASNGHKANAFAGYYRTPERIKGAMIASYGTKRPTLRSSVSYHWRPQPVILVSDDGRSASLRARLLQPSTSIAKAGSINSAIYQDQVVLEDGKWRLWSVQIDEFYWQSSSWQEGWSNAKLRNSSEPSEPASWTKKYPPDLTLAAVGDRESDFRGSGGPVVEWPSIKRMWFPYRNPVSGREPEFYWPGCVPCQSRKDWSLEANGYQEPATSPESNS